MEYNSHITMQLAPDLVRLFYLQLSSKAFYASPRRACLIEKYQRITRERFRTVIKEISGDSNKLTSRLPDGTQDGISDIIKRREVNIEGFGVIAYPSRSYQYFDHGFNRNSLEELPGQYLYGIILHQKRWFGITSYAYSYDSGGVKHQMIFYYGYLPFYTAFYNSNRIQRIQPHNPFWKAFSLKEKLFMLTFCGLLNCLLLRPCNTRQFLRIVGIPIMIYAPVLFKEPTSWLIGSYRWLSQKLFRQ
jgi:hypothetical protein